MSDRYVLTIKTDRDPPITAEGTWTVISAVLQALTKYEYALTGVASIEVKRV